MAMATEVTKPPAAPTRAQFGKLQDCKKIGDALRHPEMLQRFNDAVPRHLSPDRMLRVMAQAVYKTPRLAECNMMSLLGAMLSLASLGLEPNNPLGQAYLIPFEKRKKNEQTGRWESDGYDVQIVVGYRGLIDLARRSGAMVSIHADVVYEKDDFTFEYGSNMHLRHVPKESREGRQPIWAYCHVKLKDGEAFEVLPYEEVLRIRDNAEGYKSAKRAKDRAPEGAAVKAYDSNPWVAYEHEMAAKTMIRRVAKRLPLTIEFATAVNLDEASDRRNIDYGQVLDGTAYESTIEHVGAIASSEETAMPIVETTTQEKEPVPVVVTVAQNHQGAAEMAQNRAETTKPVITGEVVRQTAFEEDAARAAKTASTASTPEPEVLNVVNLVDDLQIALIDAENIGDVDLIWEHYEPRVALLEMHMKQAAIALVNRARKKFGA